jgi:type I restriction enzyme S subunit
MTLGASRRFSRHPTNKRPSCGFWDHANRKIDGFIRAKRKLIGLLNEQKQAIIHRAVTGKDEVRMVKDENGNSSFILQPSTLPKKPSGIPWLGDIPQHWEARQLRRVCRKIKTGGTPKGADEQFFEVGGFNWHTPFDFREAIELGDASRQLSKMGVSEVTIFPADTILMIGIGATIGKVSISRKPCSCNQQINAILPNKRLVHLDFLAFYLRTLRRFIFDCGKFTTMPIINQDETKRLPVLIPPLQEQIEIAKQIERASTPFTTAIARTEREIALMQEYRTRLTADLVTGKLDVREAAAHLPAPPADTSAEEELGKLLEEPEAEEEE